MPISIILDEHDEFRWTSIETRTSEDGVLENFARKHLMMAEAKERFLKTIPKRVQISTGTQRLAYRVMMEN